MTEGDLIVLPHTGSTQHKARATAVSVFYQHGRPPILSDTAVQQIGPGPISNGRRATIMLVTAVKGDQDIAPRDVIVGTASSTSSQCPSNTVGQKVSLLGVQYIVDVATTACKRHTSSSICAADGLTSK